MTHRRRGIFSSFATGFSQGLHRNGGDRHSSFMTRQDMRYHRNKHRRHAVKHTWHMILGVVVIVILLLCICGGAA